jgi:hypothetical protein
MIWPMTTDTPHLRLMPPEEVNAFCDRAIALCPDSYTVRLEADGFRLERTPWSATRLANALDIQSDNNQAIGDLVGEIDRAAEACAGLVPTNRLSRRL